MLKFLRGPGVFRLVLAFIVVVNHTTRFEIGVSAVYLFFGLSGYWIYQMYTHKYSKAVSPYVTYIISRLWRLLPVFILINAATILVDKFYYHPNLTSEGWTSAFHFAFSSVLILGYDSLRFKPIVPAWSLDLEVQFYLIAPCLIWLVRRCPWVLLIVSAILTSVSIYFKLPFFTGGLFFFSAGMASAALSWKPSTKIAGASLVAVVLLILVCLLSPLRGVLLSPAHGGHLHIYNGSAQVLVAVIGFPLAMFTTRQKGSKHDSTFGELSYIVYLLHWVFINCFVPPANFKLRLLEEGAMLLIIVAISYAILRVFDKPMNRRRTAWVKSRVMQPVSS